MNLLLHPNVQKILMLLIILMINVVQIIQNIGGGKCQSCPANYRLSGFDSCTINDNSEYTNNRVNTPQASQRASGGKNCNNSSLPRKFDGICYPYCPGCTTDDRNCKDYIDSKHICTSCPPGYQYMNEKTKCKIIYSTLSSLKSNPVNKQ